MALSGWWCPTPLWSSRLAVPRLLPPLVLLAFAAAAPARAQPADRPAAASPPLPSPAAAAPDRAGAVATRVELAVHCHESDFTCPTLPSAPTVRTLNFVLVGALAATWAFGVADAFWHADRETEPALSFVILPTGAALGARF